jgi:hypothetical protein
MSSQDLKFKNELEMIDDVLSNGQGLSRVKEYFSPFVESLVSQYIGESKYSNIPRETLIEVGWKHLEPALKKYRERAVLMLEGKNEMFYFETYFSWYVRQAIVEYIKSTNKL